VHDYLQRYKSTITTSVSNALLNMYVECGNNMDAISFWEELCKKGVAQDSYTYALALTACANLVAREKGKKIYKHFCQSGLERDNTFVNTAVLNMYAKVGAIDIAENIFTRTLDYSTRGTDSLTVISYNAMLAAYPTTTTNDTTHNTTHNTQHTTPHHTTHNSFHTQLMQYYASTIIYIRSPRTRCGVHQTV
jgi:hypothetical protein